MKQPKTIAIIQPSFLPWRGYFQIIKNCDEFIFYDDVQFDRRGWRNRNQIKTTKGLQWITVPVHKKGLFDQFIFETKIDYSTSWVKKMLNSIQCSYGKAPFFKYYFEWIAERLNANIESISQLDMMLTKDAATFLKLQTVFVESRNLEINSTTPIERLVEICNKRSATHYLSGPSAKNYICNSPAFLNSNINLEYVSYKLNPYPQINGDYLENTSILDLFFNVGPDSHLYL